MPPEEHCPLISVLMPAYNHARYVEAAVRSVLMQDWPRVELVVVDDGSTDDTWRILLRLQPECERRLERVAFVTQANGGTTRTMNRLVSMARGDFMAVLASDDLFLPGAFVALMAPMGKNAGVGVTVGENILVDGDGRRCYWGAGRQTLYDEAKAVYRTLNEYTAKQSGVSPGSPAFGTYGALIRMNHIANGCLVRASALRQIAPFTPEAPLEDWWQHLQLSKVTRYVSVPERTFGYRWHGTNTMRDLDRIRSMVRRTLRHEAVCVRRAGDAACWNALRMTAFSERKLLGSWSGLHVCRREFVDRIEWALGVGRHEIVPWRELLRMTGKGVGRIKLMV